ncbi:putative serpin-Z12 [Triticum urartu]|uniref:putative serpin-Z12 n=1 Tax=Triticum urartu TaxID=4572 RepID=UPI002042F48D|nr:putative serpin-Z12 [Triticum urartu]
MSPIGRFVLFLTLFAAWRLRSTLFAEVPPAPGVDSASAIGNASCVALAREAGVRAKGGTARNFIISPLSIHAALAKVAAGARGDTVNELLRFLGSASLNELHRAAATELVGRLNGLAQTSFASGVWVDRIIVAMPEFTAIAASRYNTTAESVDFVSGAEQARQRVNAFVADATNKHIIEVLPPGSVNSSTAVVLANALYFKEAWSQPFDVSTLPFHISAGGTTVRVPSMTTSRSQHIAVYPGFRALKLPYKNDVEQQAEFYMLILLPDRDTVSLADLYDKAVSTPEFMKTHTPTGKVPVRRLMVPKFKFTSEFEASSDMRKLGVTTAFEGGDFSGMMTVGKGLSINGVYHKATIEVDEVDTVAAAATAVVGLGSAGPGHGVDFVADRPFLFAVVEEGTDAVLLLGHVANLLAR